MVAMAVVGFSRGPVAACGGGHESPLQSAECSSDLDLRTMY